MRHHNPYDELPDVRDSLPYHERIVLRCLHELQKERGDRHVPTGMLYGSVVEYVDMSIEEMQRILIRLDRYDDQNERPPGVTRQSEGAARR
jgi:hypothetical protein